MRSNSFKCLLVLVPLVGLPACGDASRTQNNRNGSGGQANVGVSMDEAGAADGQSPSAGSGSVGSGQGGTTSAGRTPGPAGNGGKTSGAGAGTGGSSAGLGGSAMAMGGQPDAGAGGAPTDAPPEPSPYEGTWTGTTSRNLPIAFTVNAAGEVDSLIVGLRLSYGLYTCTGPAVAASDPDAIIDQHFDVPVDFPASSVSSIVRGDFSDDGTSVSGAYEGYSGSYSIFCGGSFTIGTGSPLSAGTWTAARGNYTCPHLNDGECDEPQGTGACLSGSDALDCSGIDPGQGGAPSEGGASNTGGAPSGEGGAF